MRAYSVTSMCQTTIEIAIMGISVLIQDAVLVSVSAKRQKEISRTDN